MLSQFSVAKETTRTKHILPKSLLMYNQPCTLNTTTKPIRHYFFCFANPAAKTLWAHPHQIEYFYNTRTFANRRAVCGQSILVVTDVWDGWSCMIGKTIAMSFEAIFLLAKPGARPHLESTSHQLNTFIAHEPLLTGKPFKSKFFDGQWGSKRNSCYERKGTSHVIRSDFFCFAKPEQEWHG